MCIQLKQIDLNDLPTLGLRITDICFLFNIVFLIIFKFLNKNFGDGFELPNGPNLLISFVKCLLIEDEDISESYFKESSIEIFFFK